MNILIIYLVVLSVTASVKAIPRIVGGGDAPPVFGRFHASLQNLTGFHVCGGAIVSKFHIVTAAHCLYGAEPEYIKVVVGTSDLNHGGIQHKVDYYHIHERFNHSSKVNDIALIMVDKPFDLNYVSIIAMDDRGLHEHDVVLLSGFGALKLDVSTGSILQLLTIRVFNQDICKFAMRYIKDVTGRMFCTFSKSGEGVCKGDSGSPILRDNKLVGLVSWGVPCAVGFPDVHTRLAPYVKWLRTTIHNDICNIKRQYTSYGSLINNQSLF